MEATLMVGKDYLGSVKGFTDSVSPNLVGLDQIDLSRFSDNIIDIYDLTSAMIKSSGVWVCRYMPRVDTE